MRNWIQEENKNYLEFFDRDNKNFQQVRDRFAEHFAMGDDKRQIFWNYNEFTFVLIKDKAGNAYSIWKRNGTCLPEFVLGYNPPDARSDIVVVVPSPEGDLALFVTGITGTESRVVQIFDCRASTLLAGLIRNISGIPIFLGHPLHFYIVKHDRLNRPESLLRVQIDKKNNRKVQHLISDSDPRFSYRLISWRDLGGLLFIGKSISAVKIYCIPDFLSGEEEPVARYFFFHNGTTLAAADSTMLLVATNDDEGGRLLQTHPSNHNISLSPLWVSKSQDFVHALGQTPHYAYMILNRRGAFNLLAIDKITRKSIKGRLSNKYKQCHFSILRTEGDQHILVQAQSMTQPQQILRWDLDKGRISAYQEGSHAAKIPTKHDHILVESRVNFKASDGVEVSISLVCQRLYLWSSNGKPIKPMPALIYVYGCYGRVIMPDYSPFRDRLIQMGAIYVVIHVRGGGEFGPRWHRQGMGRNKIRGVLDLIEGIEWLIAEGYIAKDKIVGCGRSAAGILLGLAINLRPGLFKGLTLESPFLDLYGSMTKPNLPLSLAEKEEWAIVEDHGHDHLRSICPLHTVRPQAYSDVLIQCGSRDWRSPVTQIRRWIEAIRSNSTNQSIQIVYISHNSGHQLQKNLDRLTEWYFFVMSRLGILDTTARQIP